MCYLPGTGTTDRPQMLVFPTLSRGLCPQSRRETPWGHQVPCLLHGCDPDFLGCRASCGPSWRQRQVGRARLQSRLRKAPETVSFQKFLSDENGAVLHPQNTRPWHPLCCPGHCAHTLHRADTQKVDTEGSETRARRRGAFPAWGDQDSADQRQPSGPLKSPDARSPQPHASPAHQHPAPAPLWATGGWTSTEDHGGHHWVPPPWTATPSRSTGPGVEGEGRTRQPCSKEARPHWSPLFQSVTPILLGCPPPQSPQPSQGPPPQSPQPYRGPHLSHSSLTGGPSVMQLREL